MALFFGFTPDSSVKEELKKVNPSLYQLFITEKSGNYLQEINHEKGWFIGKYIDEVVDCQKLKNLEVHVCSVMQRLIPSFSLKGGSMHLLATFPNEK